MSDESRSRQWEPEQRTTGNQSLYVSILHKKEFSSELEWNMPVHSSQRKENGDGGDSLVITGEGALADE